MRTRAQGHTHTHTHTHTHNTHTYLGTCVMLTTATGCLCVLQVAQRQPFERPDPIHDLINESIDNTVSGGKCISSREQPLAQNTFAAPTAHAHLF